jgi:hypothetical protein
MLYSIIQRVFIVNTYTRKISYKKNAITNTDSVFLLFQVLPKQKYADCRTVFKQQGP